MCRKFLIYDATSASVVLMLKCCDGESVCTLTECLWQTFIDRYCYICKYDLYFPFRGPYELLWSQNALWKINFLWDLCHCYHSLNAVCKYELHIVHKEHSLNNYYFWCLQATAEEEKVLFCTSVRKDVWVLLAKCSDSYTCTERFVIVVPHHNKWIYWENIQIFFLYFHWITSMNWKTLRTESVSISNTNRYRFDHYCTLFIKRSLTASNFFCCCNFSFNI